MRIGIRRATGRNRAWDGIGPGEDMRLPTTLTFKYRGQAWATGYRFGIEMTAAEPALQGIFWLKPGEPQHSAG